MAPESRRLGSSGRFSASLGILGRAQLSMPRAMGDFRSSQFLWFKGTWALIVAVSLGGCREESDPLKAESALPVREHSTLSEGSAPPESPEPDPCQLLIETLRSAPAHPGTPTLDETRAEVLARARSVPVVFLRAPGPPEGAEARVLHFRKQLLEAEDPAHAIQEILGKTRRDYEIRRAVFLSEQYLYAEQPLLALRLSQILRIDHLFTEKTVVIRRGAETFRVTREEGRYFFPPAPAEEGKKVHNPQLANLLLFDRVRAEEEEFSESLHMDLQPLVLELGLSRLRIKKWTSDGIVAEGATYGKKSTLVLDRKEDKALLKCEVSLSDPQGLEEARREAREDADLIAPVLGAAHEMIARALPFDEPRTEEGQQDGLLRLHFRQAYRHHAYQYEFNGDQYYVFDGYGRPRLPQVCIDFITDAFDWGTGGGWPSRSEKREYKKGAIHFGSLGIENPRSIESVAEFATANPEWFDMLWLSEDKQIKFRHRAKFFQALGRDADDYRRGDVVFIYGLKDDGKFHYHSFIIDEKDPVTGIPTVVLANAGPPQARSWEGEMQNAPLRKIVARMRVRREVLKKAREQAQKQPGIPLSPPERPTSSEDLR